MKNRYFSIKLRIIPLKMLGKGFGYGEKDI